MCFSVFLRLYAYAFTCTVILCLQIEYRKETQERRRVGEVVLLSNPHSGIVASITPYPADILGLLIL